jgi:hypothetical protein
LPTARFLRIGAVHCVVFVRRQSPSGPPLAETFGADTAKKVANWLDYKGGDEGGETGAPGENGAADRAPLLIWYGEDPPPPPKYLVSNMLPEDGVALIGGQFLLGKTFVGADLSAAVMTCGVFAGGPVMRKGAILWFAAEGEKEIEGRVRASVENKFGGSGPQPFARQAGSVPFLTDPDALEKLKAHAQESAKYAREKFGLPLALIVIDTVSAAAGFTDENSASETQKVMTTLRELSRATGALVLPIDHYGKPRQASEDHPPSPPQPTRSLRASASATMKAMSPITASPSPNSATARPAASSPSNCVRQKRSSASRASSNGA